MDTSYPIPHYDWMLSWQPQTAGALGLVKSLSQHAHQTEMMAEWMATEFVGGPYDEVYKNEVHCMLDYERWGQQVFCVPKIMQEKLDATDISRVGLAELKKMPYPCFYVNLRSCGWKLWSLYDDCYYPISGFYVLRDNKVDHDEAEKHIQSGPGDKLLFFVHAEGKNGDFGSKYFMNMNLVRCFRDFDCVGDYVKHIIRDPDRDGSSPGVVTGQDRHKENGETFMRLYRVFAALLMYLNTKDPSVRKDMSAANERNALTNKLKRCKKQTGKKARRYKTILSKISGANVRYIGEREERDVVGQPGFTWEAKRSWRRGHNHNFWNGPKKFPQGHIRAGDWIPYEEWETTVYPVGHDSAGVHIRELEELWVEPVLINPDKEAEDPGPREYGFSLSHDKKHALLREFIYREGRAKEVVLNTYERDPKARAACLEHFGFICQVCDYEPEKQHKLGHLVARYLQVHHVTPLHTVGKEHTVDPTKDLVPVCYECHKYIHSRGTKKKPYSVEELRDMIDYLAQKEVAV